MSKIDVIVAQCRDTARSSQPCGFHALATKRDGFTNDPGKGFGHEGGVTTASSTLASFISHVKKVNAASCSGLPTWPLIAPSTTDCPLGPWFTTSPSWYFVAWRQKDVLHCTVAPPSLHQTLSELGMRAMRVVAARASLWYRRTVPTETTQPPQQPSYPLSPPQSLMGPECPCRGALGRPRVLEGLSDPGLGLFTGIVTSVREARTVVHLTVAVEVCTVQYLKTSTYSSTVRRTSILPENVLLVVEGHEVTTQR